MLWQKPVSDTHGKAQRLTHNVSRREPLLAILLSLSYLGCLLYPSSHILLILSLIGVTICLSTCLSWIFTRRLQGYTGDILGAIQQLSEIGLMSSILYFLSWK
ncbi:MAG: adenosylcobinamide-GDP ribazoletransferase [Cytophagales bacterium]|nr:adenosylcobinamide-GDP ribazoletransferase [Cytophagales bacterium]